METSAEIETHSERICDWGHNGDVNECQPRLVKPKEDLYERAHISTT